MRSPFFLLFLVVVLASCSDYQKVMKSTKVEEKFAFADSLFRVADAGNQTGASRKQRRRAEGACTKAIPMLEELVQLTRGSTLSERVYYEHAKCQFFTKDYIMASYYLSNFTRTFPASAMAEECSFLAAYCYYRNSPNYELDQSDTKAAIEDMQLFLVAYPDSPLKDSANALVRTMRGKLEVKDLNNSRQYYRLRNYQGTITAFSAFVRAWPNSEFREEALFTLLQASAMLARNSVEYRKKQRVAEAIQAYHNFADAFPESPDKREASRLLEELNAYQAQNETSLKP